MLAEIIQIVNHNRQPVNIDDLNLNFLLTLTEHPGRDHPDILQYKKFIQEEGLDQIVRLLIISYKDHYQIEFWLTGLFLSDESIMHLDREGDYLILDGQFLKRNDIAVHKCASRSDMHGRGYFYERIFEFYETVDLSPVVEEALADQAFAKSAVGSKTLYTVEKSPIGEIEVGPRSFRLTINPEHCPSINLSLPEIEDLNLGFLWAEKGGIVIMDAADPFWEKWDGELLKYLSFIEHAPLEKVIELLLISFKDRYPRDFWNMAFSLGAESGRNNNKQGVYDVYESQFINREDIVRVKRRRREDIYGFEYDCEKIFEFREDINLIPVVEKTLADHAYTQSTSGARLIYTLRNSPIARIELHRRRFKMVINSKYYVKRGR